MYPSSGAWDILPLEKGFAITAKLLIMIEGCVLKRLRCLLVCVAIIVVAAVGLALKVRTVTQPLFLLRILVSTLVNMIIALLVLKTLVVRHVILSPLWLVLMLRHSDVLLLRLMGLVMLQPHVVMGNSILIVSLMVIA
jgi:hypothetical protein